MNDPVNKALLPDGLRDGLPPDAAHEAAVLGRLVASFAARGYERVDPPLVEFEDSLLDGAGDAIALATFRLMDPVSQRMMGVRADITPQVARIAGSRLKNAPRPLRLGYAGPVLRVRGSQLHPERQFAQAGVELIGSDATAADAEVILLAHEALSALGLRDLSVDINLPTLVSTVCAALGLDRAVTRRLRAALDRKDAAAVAAIGGAGAAILGALLEAAGPGGRALERLDRLDLPADAASERDRLKSVIAELDAAAPDLTVTVDPVEHRGFEYQTGLSFTIFARGVRGELGRGGRYAAGAAQEPAAGFTLFLNSVIRAVPAPETERRMFLPHGTPHDIGRALRAEGWTTVAGLAPVDDIAAEAVRMRCSHVLRDGRAEPLGETS